MQNENQSSMHQGHSNLFANIKAVNPIEATEIIQDNFFNFLTVKDIKECRLVCQTWNRIAFRYLQKYSKIRLHCSILEKNFLGHFENVFNVTPSEKFSFSFVPGNYYVARLDNFFRKYRNNVKELEFHNMIFMNGRGEDIQHHQLNDYLFGISLKKLAILFDHCLHHPILALNVIQFVNEINLDTCAIDVSVIKKSVCPSKIILNMVEFYKNGKEVKQFRINNIIDFKAAKIIEINCNNSTLERTVIELDIQECVKVTQLKLMCCKVTNWDKAKCCLTDLSLKRVPFLEKSGMKIKKLSIQDSSIDLSVLPCEIESILFGQHSEISCSTPVIFPHLRDLSCNEHALEALQYFKNCNKLSQLITNRNRGPIENFNVDWIPRSIKLILLCQISNLIGNENERFQIDFLVMTCSSIAKAEKVMKYFYPKTLVFHWSRTPLAAEVESNDNIIQFINKFSDTRVIYAGPFYWRENQFTESRISRLVNKIGNRFLFVDGMGWSVTLEEMTKVVKATSELLSA